MDPTGRRTVHHCLEYSTVAVPLASLIKNGEVQVYPEVAGLFDVDYRRGALALRATRYVGYIPISDEVAVHVQARAPIGNLLWMVWRSGLPLQNIRGFIRRYQEKRGTIDSPEELYADSFAGGLRGAASRGVMKRYQARERDAALRGRLLLGPTIGRYRARGYRFKHVFQVTDLTADIAENRMIKAVGERLVRHLIAEGTTKSVTAGRELAALLKPFSMVNSHGIDLGQASKGIDRVVRGLPRTHQHYEPLLWLCYLIATKSGLAMEQVGRVLFHSIVINVADVFEHYVRRVCREQEARVFPGCKVVSGADKPLPVFVDTGLYHAEPDLYLTRAGTPVAVADVKYKPTPSREDRYELLSFCEAGQVKRAAFICPLGQGQPSVTAFGKTAGGIKIDVVRFNLAAEDMEAEERRFLDDLARSLA